MGSPTYVYIASHTVYSVDRSTIVADRGTITDGDFSHDDSGYVYRLRFKVRLLAGPHDPAYPQIKVEVANRTGSVYRTLAIAMSWQTGSNYTVTVTGNETDGWDCTVDVVDSSHDSMRRLTRFLITVKGFNTYSNGNKTAPVDTDEAMVRWSNVDPILMGDSWGCGLGIGVHKDDTIDPYKVTIGTGMLIKVLPGQMPAVVQGIYDMLYPVGTVLQYWATRSTHGAYDYAHSLLRNVSYQYTSGTAKPLFAQWTADENPIAAITCDDGSHRYLYNVTRTK